MNCHYRTANHLTCLVYEQPPELHLHLPSLCNNYIAMSAEEPPTDRAALVNRQLPEMLLSDGSMVSNTFARPAPTGDSPTASALMRFKVNGTAVRM